jgi:hypothetical protein
MATLVPPTMVIPGFLGYAFGFDTDPATAFTLTMLTDSKAALPAAESFAVLELATTARVEHRDR